MNIKKVLIIGAGTMGSGICQWFAQQNVETHLVDANTEQIQKAKANIHSSWDKLQSKEKFTFEQTEEFKFLLKTGELKHIDNNYDLIIEAIIENLEIKKDLFHSLDSKMDESTIIASNTSSFPIELLSENLSEARKKNFIGLHFFNPATIMKLVEIIKSKWSDEKTADELYQWFNSREKKPAMCKDSPGFIVNRVARNFYGEPLRIAKVDEEPRFREIDKVMKEVAGFKMGPFELMDLIGIDINYSVTQSVWNAYSKAERFAPHALQKLMVESNRFGKKTKRGFYRYE